ncbi:MAG: HPr-rel-A system PqqD family peptide chaperone [Sphingomonas sp.]|nr:MAG: HPr-rel-A system PqqD family peptide chaperone [Sphingomonas sp.]
MTRYSVEPDGGRIAIELDGYTILYHRPSRATHVLASPAPDLIEALSGGPADLPTLLARLAATHDLHADDAVVDTLRARLDELVASGLVVTA